MITNGLNINYILNYKQLERKVTTINIVVKQVNTSGLKAWISNSDYRSHNEGASTQLTALLLEWARERVQGSSSTANIRMPLEWDAVNRRTY